MRRGGIVALALVAGCSAGNVGGATSGSTGGRTSGGTSSGDAGPHDAGYPSAPHAPFPTVPDNGGPTIPTPVVETLTYPDDTYGATDRAWATWAVQSDWLAQVGADYGVKLGTYAGDAMLNGHAPQNESDDDVRSLLAGLFGDGGLAPPQASAAEVYMVFIPSQTQYTGLAGAQACMGGGFLGYHSWFSYGDFTVVYAVICDCGQNLEHMDPEAIQDTAGHELIESLTDPLVKGTYANGGTSDAYRIDDPANPYYSIDGQEIADLCEEIPVDYQDPDAGFFAQRVWSNSAAQAANGDPCIPPPAGTDGGIAPFYAVSSASAAYYVSPGGTVTVPVVGWSTAAVPDFCLVAEPGQVGDFQPEIDLPDGGFNNGVMAELSAIAADITPNGPLPDGGLQLTYGPAWIFAVDCDAGAIESLWAFNLVLAPVGQPCNPSPAAGAADFCATFGLLCLDGGCGLPERGDTCLPAVGCAGALNCLGDAGPTCG